jgi:hypothetical protein
MRRLDAERLQRMEYHILQVIEKCSGALGLLEELQVVVLNHHRMNHPHSPSSGHDHFRCLRTNSAGVSTAMPRAFLKCLVLVVIPPPQGLPRNEGTLRIEAATV